MGNTDDKPAFKITLEDLAKVTLPQEVGQRPVRAGSADDAPRQYGTIATGGQDAPAVEASKGSIFLQGWFYLGVAGLAGALIGWAIGEPFFYDGPNRSARDFIGKAILIPLVLVFLCLGFSIAESIVERSMRKALQRAALSLPVGAVLSLLFMIAGGMVYNIGLEICAAMGIDLRNPDAFRNPATWVARSLGWVVFAAAAGVVYGLVDRSMRKGRYGVLGAMIGGGLGGFVFNPINIMTPHAGASRAVGFGLIGLAAGVAIGIVESALKDRWLYVAAGPLAGKQFILYKPVTVIGSSQQCDIYLFKDNSIQPQHASIELRGAQTFLHAVGPVFVSGQPARHRALQTGDLVQIGRYAFHFRERHKN